MSLFNIDVAAIVNGAMGNLLLKGTLTKVTRGVRTPGSLTDGPAETTLEYDFKGVFEEYREGVIDGTLIQDGDRKVLILAYSLPLGSPRMEPEIGDSIVLEEEDPKIIINVKRDPAGATFVCQVR